MDFRPDVPYVGSTHTPPRPSTAPHAEFERQTVEAFQGIRAELDQLTRKLNTIGMLVTMLAADTYRPSRWTRFVGWLRRNLYDAGPS